MVEKFVTAEAPALENLPELPLVDESAFLGPDLEQVFEVVLLGFDAVKQRILSHVVASGLSRGLSHHYEKSPFSSMRRDG